jgi:hypothetical protein
VLGIFWKTSICVSKHVKLMQEIPSDENMCEKVQLVAEKMNLA